MSHSEKGLKTLSVMNTTPEEWGLTDIKWVQEKRMMPVKAKCPDCHGIGKAWVNPEGKAHDFWKHTDLPCMTGFEKKEQIEKYSLKEGKCPTCPSSRKWSGRGTGEVVIFKEMKVWVGYVQWHSKTVFDSRFNHTSGDCHLCSKRIKQSRLVPVTAKGKDGIIHGMWVGMDCARKFFGIKNFKKDEVINVSGVQ